MNKHTVLTPFRFPVNGHVRWIHPDEVQTIELSTQAGNYLSNHGFVSAALPPESIELMEEPEIESKTLSHVLAHDTQLREAVGKALAPIGSFYMNGTEVILAPAMPPMGKASPHVLCLVGTAPAKAGDIALNEPFRLDGYAHAMQMLNVNNQFDGTLSLAVEYILARVACTMYVIVVEEGANAAETLTNIVGSVDGSTGANLGLLAVPQCQEQPTIVYCPAYADLALGQKLCIAADKVKALPVIDAPNSTKVAAAEYSGLFGGLATKEEGLSIAYPNGLYRMTNGETGIVPAGARLVAALAAVQMWQSPQNQLDGCQENTQAVGYSPSSIESDHNFLNKHGVFTFCHSLTGGIACMGNRAHSGTFVSSIGLRLAMSRKLTDESEIYKGKMMTHAFAEAVVLRINSWLKTLKTDDGSIIDARASVSAFNTIDSYRSGTFMITVSYGEYTPLEHFKVTLAEDLTYVERYVEELKGII